jgi:hypothetical protein
VGIGGWDGAGTGSDVARTCGVALGGMVVDEAGEGDAGARDADASALGSGDEGLIEPPAEGEATGGHGAGPRFASATIPTSTAAASPAIARRCDPPDGMRTTEA